MSRMARADGRARAAHGHEDPAEGSGGLLTPSEVAALFRVDPKTVTRWVKAGLLDSIRTLGGHRRYRRAEVMDLLSERTQNPPP